MPCNSEPGSMPNPGNVSSNVYADSRKTQAKYQESQQIPRTRSGNPKTHRSILHGDQVESNTNSTVTIVIIIAYICICQILPAGTDRRCACHCVAAQTFDLQLLCQRLREEDVIIWGPQ